MESTKVLIVDDEVEYRETYRMLLEDNGYIVGEAGNSEEALKILEEEYYPVVLSDILMPGDDGITLLKQIKSKFEKAIEVIIVTGYGSIQGAVEAMRIGALGYFIKSHSPEALLAEINKAARLVNFETQRQIIRMKSGNNKYLNQSKNSQMQNILDTIRSLETSNCNILLTGESGVGKEIIAKWIHDLSSRSNEIFLPVNCQAISENILESELFGHEKGAFTGATNRRIGRFEESHGGTLFLDEIGELTQATQVKLLRVLDNRYIERIGSNKQIPVNFRLISATNRELSKEMNSGRFREDLFYRINTMHIEIPPLRERREDLKDMIDFFIERFSSEMKKEIVGIDPVTESYLLSYNYPGNVRELKNIIERLVVLSKSGFLKMNFGIDKSIGETVKNSDIMSYKDAKKSFEIDYISNALELCNKNITKTAKAIGMSRRQLFNKIIEYRLNE